MKNMEEIKNWPEDYSDEKIRDIITQGDSSKANGMASWKEAGTIELGLRQKKASEKRDLIIIILALSSLLVSLLK